MAGTQHQAPGKSTFFWIVLIVVFLYGLKIHLREPQFRHVEVCYLPHKVASLFWVDLWGAVVPDDNRSLLKHARDLEQFFFSCTSTTRNWGFLRYGESQKNAQQ